MGNYVLISVKPWNTFEGYLWRYPIYTLAMDVPTAWLVRPRETLYDLDNIQLGKTLPRWHVRWRCFSTLTILSLKVTHVMRPLLVRLAVSKFNWSLEMLQGRPCMWWLLTHIRWPIFRAIQNSPAILRLFPGAYKFYHFIQSCSKLLCCSFTSGLQIGKDRIFPWILQP